MNIPFTVVCIDDSHKPNDIPLSKWVKKGITYTVIEVSKMRIQGGVLGFKLEEIDLSSCFPYQYFAARRFAVLLGQKQTWVEEELSRLLEEAKKEAEPQVL
jgi:hypothetical protein